MKKFYLGFAAIAMLAVACNKEQTVDETLPVEEGKVLYEIKVTIDPETKGVMTGKSFAFSSGDEIAVIVTEAGTPSVETLSVTANDGTTVTFAASLSSEAEVGDYAYYPASIANAATPTTINWPSSFDGAACGGCVVPMMAKIEGSTAEFKHLGAMLKVNVADAPASIDALEFTTSSNFTGTYDVNTTTWALTANTLGGNVETVSVNGNGEWFIPIPAGTYADFRLAMKDGSAYLKQKTANLASAIAPGRTQIVNLGDFTYDIDKIEEWYLLSDFNSWNTSNKELRLIKIGDDEYEISSYVFSENPWYKFYSPTYDVSGVAGNTNGTMASGQTCKLSTNEIFTSTLTKEGSDWTLSYKGYGSDWDRCYDRSNVTVYLKGTMNSWGTTNPLTKLNQNNNMLWYLEGFEVADNTSYEFKFYVKGSDWEWWIGGNSVNLVDSRPYAQAVENNGGDMSYTLTCGTYNVYLDIRTLNFMFVKQ